MFDLFFLAAVFGAGFQIGWAFAYGLNVALYELVEHAKRKYAERKGW